MQLSAKRPSKTIKNKLLEDVTDKQETKKRLNAEVESSLYRRIKTQAVVIEDRSISEITRELWIEYLNKQKSNYLNE